MLEWFDYYLKGIGEQPGQWIEIQSNQGSWRIENRYPPDDATELLFELGNDMTNIAGTTTVLCPMHRLDPSGRRHPGK